MAKRLLRNVASSLRLEKFGHRPDTTRQKPTSPLDARVAPFVFCALLIICSSCATQGVLKKSRQMEARGNYGEAYTNIVQGLKNHPKNEILLTEKIRVGELFSQDLLKIEANLPTNNLVQRIQLLETASSVDSANQVVIATALDNLRSVRIEILKRAGNLTNFIDLAAMLDTAEPLLIYTNSDAELYEKLVNSPVVIGLALHRFGGQALGDCVS
jgi:hypothetical protein